MCASGILKRGFRSFPSFSLFNTANPAHTNRPVCIRYLETGLPIVHSFGRSETAKRAHTNRPVCIRYLETGLPIVWSFSLSRTANPAQGGRCPTSWSTLWRRTARPAGEEWSGPAAPPSCRRPTAVKASGPAEGSCTLLPSQRSWRLGCTASTEAAVVRSSALLASH
jgi:hypothetical protein